MSLSTTLLLGFIAGVTILFGLPLARLRNPAPNLRLVLNAIAIGVLLFLLWDVLRAAWEPIDTRLVAVHDHTGGLAGVLGFGAIMIGGLAIGLLAMVFYEGRLLRASAGNRAASADGAPSGDGLSPQRLALLIAVGIGLHNFAEGLAIGQAAAGNDIALATVLVVGFALHNATEGFGIAAPLAAGTAPLAAGTAPLAAVAVPRPSWGRLLGLGVIGGGPTFLGTAVGHNFTNEPISVLFLTLAAGSIIYVVLQLLGISARARRPDLVSYGLLVGLLAGFITDAVVTAGGA